LDQEAEELEEVDFLNHCRPERVRSSALDPRESSEHTDLKEPQA
jgi:hypothetical protein